MDKFAVLTKLCAFYQNFFRIINYLIPVFPGTNIPYPLFRLKTKTISICKNLNNRWLDKVTAVRKDVLVVNIAKDMDTIKDIPFNDSMHMCYIYISKISHSSRKINL